MSDLMDKLLAVSTAPTIPRGVAAESRRVAEFSQSTGTIEVPEDAPEGDALDFLKDAGQDPADWEVTGFKRSEWGDPEAPFVSTRFTFKRRKRVQQSDREEAVAEVLEWIGQHRPQRLGYRIPSRDLAVLAIGDLQLGKLENMEEGLDHSAANAVSVIDQFVADLQGTPTKEVLVAWLGDHGEGFVSQGGANTWRTKLTLSEQIRATRRVMFYAIERFHPLTDRLVMAAVGGNHGEAQRIAGKGVTRYDDNHDVEALNAVAEALSMSGTYKDVEVYVPERDELSLSVEVGGVVWGLVHGDKYRAGKHFEWWEQQAFHAGPVAAATVLLAGHYHYLLVHEQGRRTFIQVPTLGTDGAWWAHQHGARPHPGLVLIAVEEGEVSHVQPVRSA